MTQLPQRAAGLRHGRPGPDGGGRRARPAHRDRLQRLEAQPGLRRRDTFRYTPPKGVDVIGERLKPRAGRPLSDGSGHARIPRVSRSRSTVPENDLLSADRDALRPLAERMRPRTLDEMVGQRRLLAPGSALRRAIESGHVHSMILWGPPGCGKTTLALLLAQVRRCRVPRDLGGALRACRKCGRCWPKPRSVSPKAGARCCSSTRCTASTRRSRTPSCRTSSAARSCSSARPPRTLPSNSTRRCCRAAACT